MNTHSKRIFSIGAATVGALALLSVGATPSVASAPDVFSVASLTTDNPVFVDADGLAGDDDGFVGVTGSKFLFSGDNATIAYDLADLGNPYTTSVDNNNDQNNWLFSDFKTQTSYLFDAVNIIDKEYDISGIQPLDQNGDLVDTVISLSEVVTIDNSSDDCTIFASGYGRVAIWDGCAGVIYDIELPSGVVTTIAEAATFADYATTNPVRQWYETENNVSQIGVVEYDGAALHILAVASEGDTTPSGIYRYDVQSPTDAPTEVLSFGGDNPDIWKFTVSPTTNQWCSSAEDGWDAISPEGDEDELAFCATATFNTPALDSGPAPAPATLAATGVNNTGYLAVGGVILLAGAATILVARRRTAQA